MKVNDRQLMLGFMAFSFLVTAGEVALAHSRTGFNPVYEWIPIFYCLTAAGFIIFHLLKPGNRSTFYSFIAVMSTGVIVGVLGVLFHLLGNSTGSVYAWNWFIFGAPVLAPLTIAGMSIFTLALASYTNGTLRRLVGLGLLVLALTAYLDHAQSGFTSYYTWLPVLAGIWGFTTTWLAGRGKTGSGEPAVTISVCYYHAVMILMVGTGMAGAFLHIAADLKATVVLPWSRFLHHAPVLAPLLFAQLGTLGMLCHLKPVTGTDIILDTSNLKYPFAFFKSDIPHSIKK